MYSDARRGAYEPPAIHVVGSITELTLTCDKTFGSSDGFTFQGNAIVCATSS